MLSCPNSGPTVQTTPDAIEPTPDADLVLTYTGSTWDAGVKYDGGASKVVFFGFGFEGIIFPTVRDQVMDLILDWFGS